MEYWNVLLQEKVMNNANKLTKSYQQSYEQDKYMIYKELTRLWTISTGYYIHIDLFLIEKILYDYNRKKCSKILCFKKKYLYL